MSTTETPTQETTLPPEVQSPDPTAPANWKEEFEQQWLQTKLGYEGFMLDKIQRQQEAVFKLAEQAKTGKFDSAPGTSAAEDMGVSIGNKVINYHMASTATSTPTTTTTSTPVSKVGNVAKWAAIAAALAGSGAAGAGLTAYLLKPEVPAVVDPTAYTNDGEIFEIK